MHRFFILLLAVSWTAGPAAGRQLGPRDGLDLRPDDLGRVTVGTEAPDFTLEDVQGSRVTLSSFRGKQHVILIFYRGHW